MKVLNQHSIVTTTDAKGLISYANDRFCELSGYGREEIIGQDYKFLSLGMHPPEFFESIYETLVSGSVWQGDICNRAKNGELYWLQTTIAAVRDANNQLKMFVSIQTDVTAHKKKYEQLELLQTCVDRANDVIIISEAEPIEKPGPRIIYVNKAFETVTGFSREEAIGNTPRMLQGADSNRPALARIHQALKQWKPCREEVLNYTKTGQLFWAELDISPVANELGFYTHWVSVQRDITERKLAEENHHRLTFYDPLTNLPNRRLMMERLTTQVNLAKHDVKKGALLYIDLDEFKNINDIHNHSSGDLILQKIGERLLTCIGSQDTVAHVGGDEFVVIVGHLGKNSIDIASYAERVGDAILASLRQAFTINNKSLRLTASIGIALFDDTALSSEGVLKQAEIAMHQGKGTKRNSLHFFDPIMQESIEQRAEFDKALEKAIADQEFQLYYQAQVNEKGKTIGAEALIRWISPERGLTLPADFIGHAEENGMIFSIGRWVVHEACRQLNCWAQNSITQDLTLSINVSAHQFQQQGFADQIISAIKYHNVNPAKLKIELTESIMLGNIHHAIEVMKSLKQIGIQLSLDDFGTGYSSLAYLKLLPIDQLKIDQSFVRNIVENASDHAIVKTIIAMAKAMELEVIAEGVETQEQLKTLSNKGCTRFQGYLFGKPVTNGEFEKALTTEFRLNQKL